MTIELRDMMRSWRELICLAYMNTYKCICMCMYVYMCIHTHEQTLTNTYTKIHTNARTQMIVERCNVTRSSRELIRLAHMHTQYAYTYAHIHIHIYVHTHKLPESAATRRVVRASSYIHTYIMCAHIRINTHIHTQMTIECRDATRSSRELNHTYMHNMRTYTYIYIYTHTRK